MYFIYMQSKGHAITHRGFFGKIAEKNRDSICKPLKERCVFYQVIVKYAKETVQFRDMLELVDNDKNQEYNCIIMSNNELKTIKRNS